MSVPTRSPRRAALAAALDLVLVLVFLLTGRASHGESPLDGLVATAWPFVVGLGIGWALVVLLRRDPWGMQAGAIVWILTLGVGMLLRVVAGGTAAVAFIVVATIGLALLLLGWRLVGLAVRRMRRRV